MRATHDTPASPDNHDVIVIGLGATGAAAVWQLARAGVRVLGIDRHAPPHTNGSTHGRTRIIREAYFEDPCYVPFIRTAYDLWHELEAECGERLLHFTGGLMVGPLDGVLVSGALTSARLHGIPHELLDAAEVERRFPGFHLDEDMHGVLEERAGLLLPERCIEAFLAGARARGAVLRTNEEVTGWKAVGDGVEVTTSLGRYTARTLVLAAGPWMPALLADLQLPLTVERQLFHWFRPLRHAERFTADNAPIALWEYAPDRIFATFPDMGDGLKAGIHHEGPECAPDTVDRTPSDADEAAIRALLQRHAPDANGELLEARVCLYTNTPDHHFILDRHPHHEQVIIASPCSGHGFKFAPATGAAIAELVLTGATTADLGLFRLARFARTPISA